MPNKKEILGATMFVLGDSISISDLSTFTNIDKSEVTTLLDELQSDFQKVGLKILNTKDGVQLLTISGIEKVLEKIKEKELSGDLTPSQLQVMTVIAYMPGCTRSDISYIRGAQSGSSIRNLTMRGLVYRKEEQCFVTNDALTYLGVDRPEDLPEFVRLNADFKAKLAESLSFE